MKIGRWLLDTVIEEGRKGLAIYMRQRVRVFQRRWKKARSARRKRWLEGRIRRWRRGARWLESKRARRLSARVAKQAKKYAEQELGRALEPAEENFNRWARSTAAPAR